MIKNQRAFAEVVGDYLDGNLAGSRGVFDVRSGLCDQDHLYSLVKVARPELSSEFLRGLLRSVQKSLELGAQHG